MLMLPILPDFAVFRSSADAVPEALQPAGEIACHYSVFCKIDVRGRFP